MIMADLILYMSVEMLADLCCVQPFNSTLGKSRFLVIYDVRLIAIALSVCLAVMEVQQGAQL